MKFVPRLVLAAAALCVSLPALAQERDPNQAAFDYRHSVFVVILGNLGPIAAMVKGNIPFDGDEMAMRAERIGVLSTMIEEGFKRDTRGADLDTRAKDDIWENFDDFASKARTLTENSALMAKAARAGESEAQEAFKKLGGSCKACHDEYREEE